MLNIEFSSSRSDYLRGTTGVKGVKLKSAPKTILPSAVSALGSISTPAESAPPPISLPPNRILTSSIHPTYRLPEPSSQPQRRLPHQSPSRNVGSFPIPYSAKPAPHFIYPPDVSAPGTILSAAESALGRLIPSATAAPRKLPTFRRPLFLG